MPGRSWLLMLEVAGRTPWQNAQGVMIMAEESGGSSHRSISAPHRRSGTNGDRRYVRFVVLGDRGGWPWTPWRDSWPQLLSDTVATSHDISWCDPSKRGATAYDVRRVQLRVAVAHRPHLAFLDLGHGRSLRRHRDIGAFHTHLTHCCQVLTDGAAVLVTARSRRRGLDGALGPQLDAVYEELARDFGTIHLDLATGSVRVIEQFAEAARGRGLELNQFRRPQ